MLKAFCQRALSVIVHLFCRLCYVKLKLLLIAIEYKSDQRESR